MNIFDRLLGLWIFWAGVLGCFSSSKFMLESFSKSTTTIPFLSSLWYVDFVSHIVLQQDDKLVIQESYQSVSEHQHHVIVSPSIVSHSQHFGPHLQSIPLISSFSTVTSAFCCSSISEILSISTFLGSQQLCLVSTMTLFPLTHAIFTIIEWKLVKWVFILAAYKVWKHMI